MSDNHAARVGDDLIHTSVLADVVSVVAEGMAYAAIGMAVGAAIVAAAPAAGAGAAAAAITAVGESCLLSGMIGGALASITGLADDISASATALGNLISPPSPAGKITSGSPNVMINGKPAARAAGMQAPPQADTPDTAQYNDMSGAVLGMAAGMASQMWQPTVAGADNNTSPLSQDSVGCEKHSDPQYLAEGSSNVFINGQPAVRAGDRTTCEATVSTDVSPNVIIGGGTLTVRPIRSGKLPGLGLALTLLPMLLGRPGQVIRNLPCMLLAAGGGMAANALTSAAMAVFNPVHAPSGVKVLNGDSELDVVLPGRLPFRLQRAYNSLSLRDDGLFGTGWHTPFDTGLTVSGDQATWYEETGREIRFTLPSPDSMLLSPAEGILVRRNAHGDVVIGDQDSSLWRLYKPTARDPGQLRLAQLCDEYGNTLTPAYDDDGRLVRITDSAGAIDVTLTYGHPDFPQRVTALSQDDGQQRWPLMTWTYDHRGMLAGATDATGITRRAYRYNDDRLMVWHRQAGGPECEYRWKSWTTGG